MTPEEACEYLDISMDDDLDLAVLERNYQAKSAEWGNSQTGRRKIDEAYHVLLELYDELYRPEHHKNEGLFMKLAVLMAGVFLLSFAGVMYFVYKLNTEKAKPVINESVMSQDYARVLQELQELRRLQEEAARTPPPSPSPSASTPTPESPAPQADYSSLVERVMPSMVFIETDRARGSGFFVSSGGDILTNHHVIKGAEVIRVTTHDGRTLNASVKDYDSVRDMALLKVSMSGAAPYLRISRTLPKQGEAVIAIGSPKGLSGTVSNGIVSAIREMDSNLWVQFTAPISPGSSGGALINLQGEVIGMPTKLMTEGQNLNFAVAPTVLAQFFSSAVNKAARAPADKSPSLKTPAKRTPDNSKRRDKGISTPDFGDTDFLKFIRRDDSYEVYLYTDNIAYDWDTGIASFISVWLPSERTKASMKRDPNFNAIPGKEFGPCVLVYVARLHEGTYMHLRTINLYTDGTTARDYVKPANEYEWSDIPQGSRIDVIIREVRKQLRM